MKGIEIHSREFMGVYEFGVGWSLVFGDVLLIWFTKGQRVVGQLMTESWEYCYATCKRRRERRERISVLRF